MPEQLSLAVIQMQIQGHQNPRLRRLPRKQHQAQPLRQHHKHRSLRQIQMQHLAQGQPQQIHHLHLASRLRMMPALTLLKMTSWLLIQIPSMMETGWAVFRFSGRYLQMVQTGVFFPVLSRIASPPVILRLESFCGCRFHMLMVRATPRCCSARCQPLSRT